MQLELSLLLFGPRILEPDLNHSLLQPNLFTQSSTFRHGWRFVNMEDTLHDLDLNSRHLGSKSFVAALVLVVAHHCWR